MVGLLAFLLTACHESNSLLGALERQAASPLGEPLIRASHDGSLLGDLILISGFRSVVELGAKFKHGYMRAPIILEGLGSDYKHRTTLIWSLHQKYAIFKGRPNMKQSQNFCFSVYPRCGPIYFPRATSLNLQHVRLSPQKLAIPQKKTLAIR